MRVIITLLLLMALSVSAFSQERNCGAMEDLEHQLQHDPEMHSRMEAIERHTEHFIQTTNGQGRAVITIPVVFHVVHNGQAVGTAENVSDAYVLAQLEQMNQDFALANSDASLIPSIFQPLAANTEIQFCLAQRKPDGTATTGINRISGGRASWTTSQINSSLKPSSIWDRNQYLNVWSVKFGGADASLLGYAQFPGGAANTDGVVVLYSSMGSVASPNPDGGVFGRGRTLTHEVGHWLNLRHIWGDATCGNDMVSDTPVHNTSNGGCPTYPHYSTCTGSPIEMTMNYMDYTNDACMYMFTAGQKARMQAVLASGGARFSLTSSAGCTPVGSTACNVPGGLNASGITTAAATLNWSGASGATAYNVRHRATGTTTWTTASNVSGTSRSISGLAAATQYEFQVQSVCGGSTTSAYSGSATFTTNSNGGGGCTTNLITVSITLDNYPAETSWQITNASGTVVASGGSYTVAGATVGGTACLPDGCYTFTILDSYNDGICCSYGNGSYSVTDASGGVLAAGGSFTSSQATQFCQPNCGTPTGLGASAITTSSATLGWSAAGGASSYNVRRRAVGTSAWTTSSTSATSTSVSGLTAATQYEFQVQSVCGSTSGAYSASATFTTASNPTGCSDAYEPNNSRSTSLPLTATNQDLFAQIATSTDRDWYRFANSSAARNIRIDLSDLPADYDLDLYQNSTRRGRSTNGGTTAEVITYNTNTTASNWYAYVYGYNGANSNTQCYKLRISLSSSAFRTDGTTDGIVEEIEVEVPVIEKTGFAMFPNPASDLLTLDMDMNADRAVQISVSDITGKVMLVNSYQLQKDFNRVTLNVGNLPSGIYIVRVDNGDLNGIQKLVITR